MPLIPQQYLLSPHLFASRAVGEVGFNFAILSVYIIGGPMIDRKVKREDILSDLEFTEFAGATHTNPTEDSPGDSAENLVEEVLVGMEYDEETLEDTDADDEDATEDDEELEDDEIELSADAATIGESELDEQDLIDDLSDEQLATL